MEDQNASESTRLLDPDQQQPAPLSPKAKRPGHWRVILAVLTIHLLLNIARCIAIAPDTSIMMDIVCRQYYAPTRLDSGTSSVDDRCKAEPVQSEVAYINSWRHIVEFFPGILLALPYGALADHIGRKKVLLLAMLGCFLSDVWLRLVYWFPNMFPVRASSLGGMFYLLGAGGSMMGSLEFVIVADVCPAELRATAFAWIQSALLLAQFVFTPVGGALISLNPWIPMFISSGFMVVAFLVAIFFLPETLPQEDHKHNQTSGLLDGMGHGVKIKNQFQQKLANLADFNQWFMGNMTVFMVLLPFFFFTVGQQENSSLLLQYAYKRFNWSLGQASYLFSISAGTTFVVLVFLIPATSTFLRQRLDLHEAAKDKIIAQISGLCLSVGSGLIFLAASGTFLVLGQLLVSLGSAFGVLAKSVVASMVEQRHLATIFTTISILNSLGSLVGAPLLAYAFKQGMKLGSVWVGIPFLIATGCFVLALLTISLASTDNKKDTTDQLEPQVDGVEETSATRDASLASQSRHRQCEGAREDGTEHSYCRLPS